MDRSKSVQEIWSEGLDLISLATIWTSHWLSLGRWSPGRSESGSPTAQRQTSAVIVSG